VKRRSFVGTVGALLSGCLGGADDGIAGSIIVYSVPDRGAPSVPLDDPRLDVRPIQVSVKTAPVYKERDIEDGMTATSTTIESDEVYDEVREALDSTPSVEAGDPYPEGGTVVEFEGNLFLLALEEA